MSNQQHNPKERQPHENDEGWIGVDLDGTLAFYDRWRGASHIGAPIPQMVAQVNLWLKRGRKVKIFTARAGLGGTEFVDFTWALDRWCIEQFGRKLEATNVKDFKMVELWDDRAVGVVMNKGLRVS